jgi:excisionase family DNA binding protein
MNIMTAQELADYLGISTRTLSRWAKDGKGPPRVKQNGFICYRREAVDRWLVESENAQ